RHAHHSLPSTLRRSLASSLMNDKRLPNIGFKSKLENGNWFSFVTMSASVTALVTLLSHERPCCYATGARSMALLEFELCSPRCDTSPFSCKVSCENNVVVPL